MDSEQALPQRRPDSISWRGVSITLLEIFKSSRFLPLHGTTKICYIYHSETGYTRSIADRCLAATGGDRIEVCDLQDYGRISKYLIGARRAMKGLADPIEPSSIDVSDYDRVVIGSSV